MASRETRRTDDRALYIISVAAELAGVHPQTLRIYERKGLLRPARTSGNTRRYSDRDIDRLRTIQDLTQAGVNLAGVKKVIELQAEVDRANRRIEDARRQLETARRQLREALDARRRDRGDLVPMSSSAFPWQRWGGAPRSERS